MRVCGLVVVVVVGGGGNSNLGPVYCICGQDVADVMLQLVDLCVYVIIHKIMVSANAYLTGLAGRCQVSLFYFVVCYLLAYFNHHRAPSFSSGALVFQRI